MELLKTVIDRVGLMLIAIEVVWEVLVIMPEAHWVQQLVAHFPIYLNNQDNSLQKKLVKNNIIEIEVVEVVEVVEALEAVEAVEAVQMLV